jgi:apolipoprotein N-acyltransferase
VLNLLLPFISAGLLILCFPRFNITWLAPFALTPLLIALARERRPLRRFAMGWSAGVVYWFGVCYWIQFVLSVHGGMGEVEGWLVFLLFCFAKALHMAVFAVLAGILMRRWWAIPAVAALWVAVEATHGSLGFAWLALGNAGIDMSFPMRLAPYTGVYGLSFLFMMMATALALAALRRPRIELLWLAPLAMLPLLPSLPPSEPGRDTALMVQPNISETENWTVESLERTEQHMAALTLESALAHAEQPPSLLIWPEAPAPFYYDQDAGLRNYINTLTRTTHGYLLTGEVSHNAQGSPLNSAILVSPSGAPVSRYDKVNLVPFGEFVPWPFGWLTDKISTEAGDFAAGKGVVVSAVGAHRIGAFICYESVFPNFVRRFADGGAQLLINISNDGWFGQSAARRQHLSLVRMRAAENRRWILRSTNDGITATIDSAGRLRGTIPPSVEATSYTGFTYIAEKTVYTRFGDWFALISAIIAILCLVMDRVVSSGVHSAPEVSTANSTLSGAGNL